VRNHRAIVVLAAVAALMATMFVPVAEAQVEPAPLAQVDVAQADTSATLDLRVLPSYLGPEVVLSGSASDSAGPPDVSVTVTNAAGATVFDGPATTALRPPLGDPAVSWRVPLTLALGTYSVSVESSRNGTALASDTAQCRNHCDKPEGHHAVLPT